jgi:hypothetical protein
VYSKTIFGKGAPGNPRLDKNHFHYVGSATQRNGDLIPASTPITILLIKHSNPSIFTLLMPR